MAAKQQSSGSRLPFLDWTRGAAALVMLQGHVFHSYLRNDARSNSPYIFSQFLGGEAPAVFLFLTGITLGFLMASLERQGLSSAARWWASARRAFYLLGLAVLFRLQLWLSGWPAPWADLLKVDVLNCMGVTVLLVSFLAVFPILDRAKHAAVLGAAIAFASPIMSHIDWTGVPAGIQGYLVPNHNTFSLFPWASFIVLGISAGSVIRLAGAERLDRVMQWSALLGAGLVMAGQFFSTFPYSLYPKSDFWLDSPNLTLIKLGVLLLILAFAYLWNTGPQGWSWVRQVGTTSLLIYWVHIELVYGRWFWFWKENLTSGQCAVIAVILIALMLGLSVLKTRRNGWHWPRVLLGLPFGEPRRASGD
ncbi:MAG: heparan-alpha-glucosaminide N-acetyltransferase domain-containing protein [Acidobacteria bacterium]|nr:heparan-alpha-glucosaminide N-acetyltransferase domain-containing protein [Acidobacteriota bacterium]